MTQADAPFPSLGHGLPLGSAVTLKSRFFLYSVRPILSQTNRGLRRFHGSNTTTLQIFVSSAVYSSNEVRRHSHADCDGDLLNVGAALRPRLSALISACRCSSFSNVHFHPRFALPGSPAIPPGTSTFCRFRLLHQASFATTRPRPLRRASTRSSAPSRSSQSRSARPSGLRRSMPHPGLTHRRLRL